MNKLLRTVLAALLLLLGASRSQAAAEAARLEKILVEDHNYEATPARHIKEYAGVDWRDRIRLAISVCCPTRDSVLVNIFLESIMLRFSLAANLLQ